MDNLLTALNKELEHATSIGHCAYRIPTAVAQATKIILKHSKTDTQYAGQRLGCIKKNIQPSPALLEQLAKKPSLPRAVVTDKAAWLYICGRDILAQGITTCDSVAIGAHLLIMDQHDHCIGYGTLTKMNDGRPHTIKNVYDIGDYLRREHTRKRKK